MLKNEKKFANNEKSCTFALAIKERSFKFCKRSGSSVWLEYMPVTHGVASSSLVRTAKRKEALSIESFFCAINRSDDRGIIPNHQF